jgi:ribosomal protein RSM22 (predicted rRNA methylase)
VNANKGELKHLDENTVQKVEVIELDAGTNSKGNPRVLFSPTRHNGAVGIRAVVEDAKKGGDDLFGSTICDAGWCGD